MTHARWLHQPIVKDAIDLASLDGEPSPTRILEEMLKLMHSLEEQFPGQTFEEIYR